MKPVLECLGHQLDAEGFHPVEAKVKAIQEAPAPTNPSELKSFLGMLNFYGKFMPKLSSTLEPLHQLVRKNVCWKWGTEQQEAFEKAKNLLQSSDVLVHYDPEKELVVSCDASPYGVGAVLALAHVMEGGSERPFVMPHEHSQQQRGVDATKVKLWTARDPVLSQVLQFVLQGWPVAVEEQTLKPYFVRREELSVHAGCLLWGLES